jgi:hypothetical protein
MPPQLPGYTQGTTIVDAWVVYRIHFVSIKFGWQSINCVIALALVGLIYDARRNVRTNAAPGHQTRVFR